MLRAPTPDETDRLHELITRIERAEGKPYVTSVEEVAEFFSEPDDDPTSDLRVLDDDRGSLIGWGRVHHSPSGQRLERAFLEGGVDPEHRGRGHGRAILGWQGARADERLRATPDHLPAVALVMRYDGDDDRARLFARTGYDDARYFDELQRPLGDLPERWSPEGITIVRWRSEHNAPARDVYNQSFADHWGSTERSAESWTSSAIESYGRRLDVSFVAIDPDHAGSGGIVGYALNAHYPEDEAVTGRRDGWIESLGTLRSHRRRGIASALIVHSLHAFEEAGLTGSMLGVDADNLTGAYAIYERLGYRPLHRGITSLRTVREPA